MTHNKEDHVPQAYKYAWYEDSPAMPLHEFLNKFKPSMVQNDGTKPWLWVRSSRLNPTSVEKEILALGEAAEVLKTVTETIESVKNDESIPLRSNKKTGAKSKKEVREQLQAEAADQFKQIAQKYGYVGGKWLIFAPHDKVDLIWSNLAKSLIEGPLAVTNAYVTKVSTSPENDIPNYQHVICMYVPDVYDKNSVTEVMKVLLRNHGCTLSGVKSDMYTCLGIDSKHPSGMQSTIWKNSALMQDSDSKALRDEFYAELRAPKATDPSPTTSTAPDAAKPKNRLVKKKQGNDDPFASDDEDGNEVQRSGGNNKRPKEVDDEDEPPKKKAQKKK
ncbi:hypothetical protein E1B28_010140 [Marasmius oreades]|uniref:Uncharacterized protein n=1 Tax=Marasmius oreades TaxID=181124 RepID=A0A9P7UTC4_9AGAR|nr:uncharacterized protein E1B28_010140 [Marasmius oreades]KAG7091084.1 hypothetical protein E1B28_010140 [Marasmius oreades]